ncbi:cell wall biogenesis protein mhp1 [Ophiostoma piceae UAMH 11346]|uniref:Cell wall biogenesis protein mhp1 n=1 Tax=Ophiostoma piceae (strain UAMH 11346) TaxID=1262450 RepID=S3BZM9_OPHP1|nr:cell wall biogenesis protein mhp1 [Ophiostoma piceae UAMH 11346]
MTTPMEHIHGIDVSWMTHGSSKDSKAPKPTSRRRNTIQSQTSPPPTDISPAGSPRTGSPVPIPIASAIPEDTQLSSSLPTSPIAVRGRRPSWFSNISSKFSTSPGSSPPQATHTNPKQAELSVPRANPAKNAVLQHAARSEGEGPYTPAPVKTSQAGLLHVFRRLSSSGGNLGTGVKGSHGLVERRILNVDRNRDRCQLSELNHAKLRRVAFCVDVEIAPMPKYREDASSASTHGPCAPADKSAKAKPIEPPRDKLAEKAIEKGEGDALKVAKSPDASQLKPDSSEATASLATAVTGTPTPSTAQAKPIPEPASSKCAPATANGSPPKTGSSPPSGTSNGSAADVNRKKEKKKRSEEERKARKERKRRQAEANGIIPMEIYLDSDDSDNGTGKKSTPSAAPAPPRAQLTPTTNPVRIYRRCCQLRETPILRKITEQLSDPSMFSAELGIVNKLDLTGYWLQLADLTTLGDFLAVVPIREVILENCGLNDEGLRVILSGLLAARKPQKKHIHLHHYSHHQRNASSATKCATVPVTAAAVNGETNQGGFVERLVLKNNKIGVEGWKHVCLFVYMCHSLKALDLSNVVFPHTLVNKPTTNQPISISVASKPQLQYPYDVCQLLSKSLGERLGGPKLELLNIGDTGLSSEQLGWIVDGMIRSGTKRLGLAHNDLDDAGVQHVARYLASGKCEGLDLGGNDLRDRLEVLADAAATNDSLWALSLADCNLAPFPLCKLLPKLVSLSNFKFLDLSHNHELFEARPSATILLRRYLPMMESLKRLHLADVAMNSEQAIALAEIIPEVKELAHLNLLQNPLLTKLSDARTEETQEQACALYASFLAATRLSTSIIAIDMPVPTAESTEIVRAMAKQVLAYCLRNVDRVTLGNPAAPILTGDPNALPPTTITPETASDSASSRTSAKAEIEYPDVIQHLVGHDVITLDEDDDIDGAPDDDYVIGGTGVAQALECCLKNRGPEVTGRPPGALGDFVFDGDTALMEAAGGVLPGPGKAKDMSKHLLQSARKIRLRLQPALQRAKALSAVDNAGYREFFPPIRISFYTPTNLSERLLFLDSTLDGIIKRFEDEFPETRVSIDSGVSISNPPEKESGPLASSPNSGVAEVEGDVAVVCGSDGEDETDILPSRLSRSNSVMSMSSKGLTNEEGRVLRAGHRFRSGWFKHYNVLSGVDEVGSDPAHNHILYELVSDINDPDINKKLSEKGIVRLFKEDREQLLKVLKEQDPEHWDRFVESQEKARANLKIEFGEGGQVGGSPLLAVDSHENEEAVIDD